MNLSNRVKKLEEKHAPKDSRIFVAFYGDDGRVQYGSDELIGKTREEVEAFIGAGEVINITIKDEQTNE